MRAEWGWLRGTMCTCKPSREVQECSIWKSNDLLMTMVQRDRGNGGNANETRQNQRPNEQADVSGSEACRATECFGVGIGRRAGIDTNDATTLSHFQVGSPHGCQTNVSTLTAPNP